MTLLVLGGTGAATRIAAELARSGRDAVYSIAGDARLGRTTDLPQRIGGFGGAQGFRAYVGDMGITAVLDATHPFAARISDRTARLCAGMGLPYCLLWRPEWRPGPGDRWIFIDREEEAARHVPRGATVFLTTGRAGLEKFANLTGCRVHSRRIGPVDSDFPLPCGGFVAGTPPFSVADERALFTRLEVDWLVVRNAGGEAPRSKLIAARDIGLPVLLLNRPAPPDARRVETVAAALDWVARL